MLEILVLFFLPYSSPIYSSEVIKSPLHRRLKHLFNSRRIFAYFYVPSCLNLVSHSTSSCSIMNAWSQSMCTPHPRAWHMLESTLFPKWKSKLLKWTCCLFALGAFPARKIEFGIGQSRKRTFRLGNMPYIFLRIFYTLSRKEREGTFWWLRLNVWNVCMCVCVFVCVLCIFAFLALNFPAQLWDILNKWS